MYVSREVNGAKAFGERTPKDPPRHIKGQICAPNAQKSDLMHVVNLQRQIT